MGQAARPTCPDCGEFLILNGPSPRREGCQSLALIGSPGLVVRPSFYPGSIAYQRAGSAFADELLLDCNR
jgi:hypothetical protein